MFARTGDGGRDGPRSEKSQTQATLRGRCSNEGAGRGGMLLLSSVLGYGLSLRAHPSPLAAGRGRIHQRRERSVSAKGKTQRRTKVGKASEDTGGDAAGLPCERRSRVRRVIITISSPGLCVSWEASEGIRGWRTRHCFHRVLLCPSLS